MNRYQFQFYPTDTPPGGNNNDEPIVHHKSSLPGANADLATLAVAAAAEWKKRPTLTLLWILQKDFEKDAADFESIYGHRLGMGAEKPAQTKLLLTLDEKADNSLKYVKGYILEKWKDADKANYPRYGIVAGNKNYRLPHDRDNRLDALALMVQAIQDDGFEDREYGLDFWNTLKDEYSSALQTSKDTDSAVSGYVGDKNVLKERVVDVLEALVHLIKANYHKTYKQVLRQFGFQKEDY